MKGKINAVVLHRGDRRIWKNPACTPTHVSWTAMLRRTRPNDWRAKYYFERGITVCERWRNYDLFFADMGERLPGTTLDRIDNDRGYEPGNCRWATKAQQITNTRANRYLEHNGERLTIVEWGRRNGINHSTIHCRLAWGWPVDLAVTLPAKYGRKVMVK